MKINHLDTAIGPYDALRTRNLIFQRLVASEPRGKALDLGAAHCQYSIWAQSLGFEMTAVDARTDNLPAPDQLASIKFVQADARDFDFSGFALIFYLGLIYHFDIPDQIETLRRCVEARASVILDTQVHVPELVPIGFDEDWAKEVVERDGYSGLAFPERDNVWASVGNEMSFWHTEASWLRMFEDVGFAEATVVAPKFQTKYGAHGYYVLRSV
jgi:hypothetical protein